MRKVRLIAAVLLVLCVVGAYAAEKNPSQNGHSGTGTQEKTAQTTQSKQQQLPKAAIAVIKPQQQPVGEFCKLACSKGNPAGNPAFDFYQLVRQWPLSYCSSGSCSDPPPAGAVFTLHGLWPERQKPIDGKMWPECCNPSLTFDEAELKGLRTEMEKYWPSWSQAEQCFWKHEWDKHGTCAAGTTGTQPLAYFAKTLTLHQEHDIAAALANAKIVPSDTATYTGEAILQALKNGFGKKGKITCKKGLLNEVTTCFDKKFAIMDCPGKLDKNCAEVEIPSGGFKYNWAPGANPTPNVSEAKGNTVAKPKRLLFKRRA